MNLMFFQLTEHPIKLRRNLLFLSLLVYLHTCVQSLSSLRIFNITIPDAIINHGLVVGIVWFSVTYFYYLYAEFFEWKSKHIADPGVNGNRVQVTTLVPELKDLHNNSFTVSLSFSNTVSKNLFERGDMAEIEKAWGKQAEVLANKVQSGIAKDLQLIKIFQSAVGRYKFANRVRLWVLDITVPAVALTLSSVFMWLKMA